MSRLIDADALIEEIKSLQVFVTGLRAGKGILNEYAKQYRESLLRIVDEQPTAYNVDKVVSELQEIQNRYCFMGYQMAIDVVKRGGIDE